MSRKFFTSIAELVSLIFRKDTRQITVRPNAAVTYTADRIIDLPAENADSTLVSRTSADALTNKDIDGGTASNTSRITLPKDTEDNLQVLTRKEGTLAYASNSDKVMYDDGTNLAPLLGGNVSGFKNYLGRIAASMPIGSLENNIAFTAGVSTRSSPNYWGAQDATKLTITRTSAALEGALSYSLANQGAGAASVQTPLFSIDLVDVGTPQGISFAISGVTASGDYDVVLDRYDSSNVFQETIVCAGTASAGTPASALLPVGTGRVASFAILGATATDKYALRFRRLSASNTASPKIDELFVGPDVQVQGIGPDKEYVAGTTYNGVALAVTSAVLANWVTTRGVFVPYQTSDGAWRLRFNVRGTCDSASRSAGVWTVNGVVLKGVSTFYQAFSASANNGAVVCGTISYPSLTTSQFEADHAAASTTTYSFSGDVELDSRPTWADVGQPMTLANRAVELFASSTTGTWDAAAAAANTVFGPAGSPISGSLGANRDKVIRLPLAPQSTDRIVLEYRLTSTGQWVDQSATGYAFRLSPNIGFGGYISAMSGTDITVSFRQYAIAGTTYDSATGAINWNPLVVDAWRIRVTSGGASVGYPISSANIVGRVDGVAPASGMVGYTETISRARSAKSSATTVTSLNIGSPTSITLKAGRTYKIFGYGAFLPVNTTTVQELDVAVSKTSATLPAVDTMGVPTNGELWVTDGRPYTSIGNDVVMPFGPFTYTVPVGSDVPIYLIGRAAFGVSTLGIYGSMTAEIIA